MRSEMPAGSDAAELVAIDQVPLALLVCERGRVVAANAAVRELLKLPADATLRAIDRLVDLEAWLPEHPRAEPRGVQLVDAQGRARLFEVSSTASGERQYVALRDAGAQQEIERRLQRRLQFERLLTGASAALVRCGDAELDAAIVDTLGEIGGFFGVDRAYVFQFDAAAQTQSNTHEWVAPGISREAHNLQDVPITAFPWLLEQLRADRVFRFESLDQLPPEAINEKEEFTREGIQSILIVPLWSRHAPIGFAGFDAVRSKVHWGEHYVVGLRLLAQMLASVIEARRLSRRLQQQALHDALTGLPNRHLLPERYAELAARLRRTGARGWLAMVDIDDLKEVNDHHGHAVGDELLREIARRLQTSAGPGSTVARLGGDEFAAIGSLHASTGAADIGDALLAIAATPASVEGFALPIHLSIGVVLAPHGIGPLDALLRAADAAMYRAKAQGKQRWVVGEVGDVA